MTEQRIADLRAALKDDFHPAWCVEECLVDIEKLMAAAKEARAHELRLKLRLIEEDDGHTKCKQALEAVEKRILAGYDWSKDPDHIVQLIRKLVKGDEKV